MVSEMKIERYAVGQSTLPLPLNKGTSVPPFQESGSNWCIPSVVLPVGFGDHCHSVELGWNDVGKDLGQSCPTTPPAISLQATAGGSPCPCDRWCEFSANCLIDEVLHLGASLPSRTQIQRHVRFAVQHEIFEYDETADVSSFIRHYWAAPALFPPHEVGDDGSPTSTGSPIESFSSRDFWGFWHDCWRRCGLDVLSEPQDRSHGDHVESLYVPCSPVGPGVQFRPETNPAPVISMHPVDDAGDFALTLNDEADNDNDLGVSFARWQDIVELVDLPPLFLAETIPFITFGLRNVPLGRRDFTSPDFSPSRLRELIWNLWQDEVRQFEDVVIHFVRPQPLQELGCPRAIVLIVEILTDDTRPGVSPFLAITCDSHDRLLDTPCAKYTPQVTDTTALIRHCSLSHLCAPRGFRQCQVLVTGVAGTGPVVVAPGALVKWVISAKLQIFARASWFPDIERFAAHVRHQVREGFQQHGLQLLMPLGAPCTVNFRLADLFHPTEFRQRIVQTCGHDDPVIYLLVDEALNLASPVAGSHFHAMAIPDDLDGVAFVTVTQVLDSAGVVVSHHRQVVLRDDHADLPQLHRFLCRRFLIDSTLPWQFQCDRRDVTSLHSVAFASVIVHTVFPSRSEGIYARQASTQDAQPPLEYSDDSVSTDSLSLLQIQAVRGRRLLLLQHDTPTVQVEVLPAVEDVERSTIVLQMPHRFYAPLAWLDRRSYKLDSLQVDIEILVDPFRPIGMVDVLCECLYLEDHGSDLQMLSVLRVPRTCSWPCLVRSLNTQLGISGPRIEAVRLDDASWFSDSNMALEDGAHCQIFVSDPLVESPTCLADVGLWCPVVGSAPLRTYIVDLPHMPSRIDLVGPGNLAPLLAFIRSTATWPDCVRLHQVRWDPNDLEPCRKLFLMVGAPVDDHQVPMLVVLHKNIMQQAWQVCYLPHTNLQPAVACRFPASRSLGIQVDGRNIQVSAQYSAPGACICCEVLGDATPPEDLPFAKGMQLLLDWMSPLPACDHTAPQPESVGFGDAPCPCDRWCADPVPTDSQVATESMRPISTDSHAVTLSLAAAIPEQATAQTSPVVDIPLVRSTFLATALANLQVELFPELPDGLKVHRSTAIEFLKHQSPSSVSSASELSRHELYIDGSATLDYCSWALAHVQLFEDGTRSFVGLLAGNVTIDPDSHDWIGAQSLDNISAELTAISVAYAYAVSLQAPCCVCPDLRFGHDLIRRQVTSKNNIGLAKLCTALGRDHYIPIEEVRAHRGNPYNELVDSVAKWAGRQAESLGSFDFAPLHSFVGCPQDLDWAWLSQIGASFQIAMPQVDYGGTLHVTPATTQLEHSPVLQPATQPVTAWSFSLKVATANVQSAREKSSGVGTRCHSLTKRFDHQWNQQDIDIVGVQEARTPQGQDLSRHYAIYCSGVDVSQGSAHFGCEIWLRKDAVLATTDSGDAIKLRSCKVVVHVADPRRLVLVLTYDSFRLVVASLHAPCLSTHHSIDDLTEWWRTTTTILTGVSLDQCIICIDANAPLGREELPLTGDYGAELENAQSTLFRQFLEDTQMTVPCTFPDCHVGDSGTWKHPKGAMCRRDYVLLSLPLKSWATRSFVMADFDRARAHIDHLPSVLCLQGWLQGLTSSSKIIWDQDKLRDPLICEQFRQALATLPLPCWDIGADDHCRIWEKQLLELGAQFFSQTKSPGKEKRKPTLSQSTLALIQFKRHVLLLARHAEGPAYDDYKAVLRDVEKQVRSLVALDQRAWFDALIQQVQLSGELHDSAHMFKLLRRLGSRKYKSPRRPLPMLLKENGSYTASVPEMQEVFRAQFAALEGGIQKSYDQLRTDHHCHDLLPTDQVDPHMLISPWDLAQAISRMKRGKVPGKNGITTELLKCA